MKLVIVRHAESDQHIGDITGGWSDTSITRHGVAEANAAGKALLRLVDERYQFLSSDMQRARLTSEIIAGYIGNVPIYHGELRELNNGEAANKTVSEAEKIRNPVTEPVLDWIPYPNAESWRMMQARIWGFLDNILQPDGRYLIVSHGNAIVEIIHWFLNLYYEDKRISYDIDTCSITVLRQNEWNERTVQKLNDTSHLG